MKKTNFTKFLTLCLGVLGMFFSQNAMAQCPDGQTEVTVTMDNETFTGENGWILYDATAGVTLICVNTEPPQWINGTSQSACVTDGNNIELYTYESFGDGWQGGTLDVVTSEDASNYTTGCSPNIGAVLYSGGSTADDNDMTNGTGDGGIDCVNPTNTGSNTFPDSGPVVPTANFSTACIQCVITCPGDVLASTPPGLCTGGFVNVPQPTISMDCLGLPACPVDVPAQTFPLNHGAFGSGNLQNTNFTIAGVPTTAAGNVTLTGAWNGDNSFGTEIPPLSLEGVFLANLPFGGGDCAENVISITIPVGVYNAAAVDGNLDFLVGADNDVNGFCANFPTSEYITLGLSVPTCSVPYSNDYNGTDNASDNYPVGTTVVTWTTQDINGNNVTCSHTVTVQDLEAPVLACPGDETIHLDAGECGQVYSFDITATDNCGIAPIPVGPPTPFEGTFGDLANCSGNTSSLSCGFGLTSQVQEIDLSGLATALLINDGCFVFDNSAWGATMATINLYEAAPGLTASASPLPCTQNAAGTLVATTGLIDVLAAGGVNSNAICIAFTTPYLYLNDGTTGLYLEVETPAGALSWNGPACNGVTSDGTNTYLCSPGCGDGYFADFGFTNIDAFFGLQGQFTEDAINTDPTAPAGFNTYASGDELPIGEHCFQFSVTDVNGNTGSCGWCVTVEEYPGPYGNLSCNGDIIVSVDENCEAIICADQVLEGGPYQCYDNYNVTVEGITCDPPGSCIFNNGTSCVTVKASQIAGWAGMTPESFSVSVSDPNDANNSCWNDGWMIEDKYAPTIECPDPVTISCLASTQAGADQTGSVASNALGVDDIGLSWGDGDTGPQGSATLTVPSAPAGAKLTGISVNLDMDHSWMGDVVVSVASPAGNFTLLNAACSINDNASATFVASGGANPCSAGATAGPHEDCPGDFATFATVNGDIEVAALNALLGTSAGAAAGDWTFSFTDNVGGDGGCVQNLSMSYTWEILAVQDPVIVENCGQYTTETVDNVIEGDCLTEFARVIERTHTVTDEKGNSASCTQVINVERTTLADVTCPVNWDGLPGNNPMLDCSGNGWIALPNGNPSPETTGYPGGASCGNIEYIYEDIKLPICEASYKIYRTWTILDWCAGGDAKVCNQTIKVMDTTAPVIDCPTDALNVSTTTNSCEAVFFVDEPGATDDCGTTINWSVAISAGAIAPNGSNYIVTGLAIGTHTITWTAEDDCGNSSSCEVTVVVTDDIVPVTVCETFHVVSLTTNEPTLVYATTFDDGSYDNCDIAAMEVRRMTPPTPCIDFDWTTDGPGIDELPNGLLSQHDRGITFWYPAVPFACCDVGGEHLVEFRVTDVNDNSNTCMVTVTVDDKLDPVIDCPGPITLDCSSYILEPSDIAVDGVSQDDSGTPTYYVDLNGPGNADNDTTFIGYYANVYDNCEVTVYVRDAGQINNCGISVNSAGNPAPINRFYTAVDGGGRTDVCVQQIFVQNLTPYTGPLSFPNDATVTSCDGLTDPGATGSPNVSNDDFCSQVAVTSEDLELPVVDGACKKILRTWHVIDWCTYNPNTGAGYWTDTQIIKVLDQEGPSIDSGCEEQFFSINTDNDGNPNNGCTGPVTLTIEASDPSTCDAELQYEYWIDVDNDGTQDIGGNTSTFSNPATPMGTHSIHWTVEDACGNITDCEYLFHVEDNTPPYMFYAQDYITELVGGVSVIWATEFQGTYGDECSDVCDWRIQVPSGGPGQTAPPTTDSHTFTAAGTFSVDWWIKDCANNWTYVTGTVNVQDNNGAPSASISGGIANEAGEGVNNVTVDLTGNAPGMDNTILSNDAGDFAFSGLPLAYNYTVTPGLNEDPLNGVSTYDLVLISKHILNIQSLDSPYKHIAADINNSGSITTFDMVELRKLILFINTEFTNNTSWRFVEADYVFANPSNPWAASFPELSYINGLTANEVADYVGIKVGDVNGSAIPNSLVGGEDRTTVGDLVFRVDDQKMVAGEEYTVNFNANDFNNVMGYQFTLSFDQNAVEFVDINAGNLTQLSDANFGLNKVNEGVITTSWNNTDATALNNNEVVFSVTFKAKSATQLSNVLSVSSRYTVAEAYNAELELMGVAIEYNAENGVVASSFDLYQNTPNPFKNETVIGFSLPEASSASLKVYDVAGRVLKTVEGDFAKGYNEVTLNRSDLSGTGVLYYTLETATDSATKKMIIVE